MTEDKKDKNLDANSRNDFVDLKSDDTPISDKATRKLIHKGNVAYRAGNFSLAAKNFLKAWDTDQENLYLLTIISHSLAKLGDVEAAISLIEKTIKIHGLNEEIIAIIGEMASDMGMFDIAEKIYNQAIQINPANEKNYIELSTVIEKQGRPDESIALMREVVKPFSNSSTAWCHLASLVKVHHSRDEACELYGKSLELDSNNLVALNNFARIQGDPEKSQALLKRAIKIDPKLAEVHVGLATSLLLEGKLKEAWKHYEFRLDPSRGPNQTCQYTHQFPSWNGSSLKGKHIFLAAEQGIGDEIYFATAFQELIKRGAILYIGCDERLIDIYERSFENAKAFHFEDNLLNGVRYRSFPELDTLVKKGETHIDYVFNIGSIAKYFWHKRSDIPKYDNGYLIADAGKVKDWQNTLQHECKDKLKIGISWRSGIVNADRTHATIGLKNIISLIANTDAEFICLQYGSTQEELDQIETETGKKLHVWPDIDLKKDIETNLALINNMDYVIGPNIATQMMAMASGARTWITTSGAPWWSYRYDPKNIGIPHAPMSKLWNKWSKKDWPQIVKEMTDTLSKVTAAQTSKRLIYIDIPRCASANMFQILRDVYSDEHMHKGAMGGNWNLANEIKYDFEYWANIKTFTGHYPYGFSKYLPGESIYGTFVREPREMLISSYYYIKRTSLHPMHNQVASGEMTLLKYLDLTDNTLCRRLNKLDLENMTSWGNQPASEVYNNALEVLDEMAFIGIASKFEKSIQLATKVCDWDHVPKVKTANKTATRPQWSDLSPIEQEAIDENTFYDQKLYAVALEKFEKQYNSYFSESDQNESI